MLKCERNQKHQTSLNDYAERSYILCKDNAIFAKQQYYFYLKQ